MRRDISLLYFLGVPDDDETVRLAEQNWYHLVDVRMTYATKSPTKVQPLDLPPDLNIRDCRPDDMTALRNIARKSHRDSRFYFDQHLHNDLCDQLYETWISESCGGYADRVLIAECRGRTVGYNTCHIEADGHKGRIGLLGVDESARGTGVGAGLMAKALRWFASLKVQEVTVATQARNLAAGAFYQRQGFALKDIGLWYHKWYGRFS